MTKAAKSLCYCTNLRRSANSISAYYDQVLQPSELTVAQYYLLINLSRLKTANITHWAEHVGLDRSTMVRNIKVLQTRGLIEAAEGHGKAFTLSAKGASALETAIPLWQTAQAQMEGLLGKEDAEALLRISGKLQEYI